MSVRLSKSIVALLFVVATELPPQAPQFPSDEAREKACKEYNEKMSGYAFGSLERIKNRDKMFEMACVKRS